MVGVAGFEPATPASRTQCSTGLSHTPTETAAYSVAFRAPQEADFGDFEPVTTGLMTEISPAGEADVARAARALAGPPGRVSHRDRLRARRRRHQRRCHRPPLPGQGP